MTTQYLNNFDHAKLFSDTCAQINLATNVAQSYTVPGTNAQKYRLELRYNSISNIFVGLNVTATTPGSGLKTTTSNLEFKPEVKIIKGGDILSFITADSSGAYVGVSLLAIPA